MDELVKQTIAALCCAVDQLVTDFRLYSLDFLPYEAHLVILTYVYSRNVSLNVGQLERVRQGFWRTSFAECYRGATDTVVSRLLIMI